MVRLVRSTSAGRQGAVGKARIFFTDPVLDLYAQTFSFPPSSASLFLCLSTFPSVLRQSYAQSFCGTRTTNVVLGSEASTAIISVNLRLGNDPWPFSNAPHCLWPRGRIIRLFWQVRATWCIVTLWWLTGRTVQWVPKEAEDSASCQCRVFPGFKSLPGDWLVGQLSTVFLSTFKHIPRELISYATTVSFYIPCCSLFTNHVTVLYCLVWANDGMLK
jgi:hypothetical protein